MGLFSSRAKSASTVADPHVEALADVVRAFGRHAFDLPNESAESMADWAEAHARSLLLGGNAALSDLRHELRRRRKAEQRYVGAAIDAFRKALKDAIGGLAEAAKRENEASACVRGHLDALVAAVDTDDPEALRARVRSTVGVVTAELEQRNSVTDRRLAELREHVEALEADLDEANERSTTDALTGLYNRGALDQDLVRLVKLVRMTRQPLTIVMIDIDHFKKVNDTHGHLAGDGVIKAVADEIVATFPRKSDYVARYGGEEFMVIARDCNKADATRMIERFLTNVRKREVVHEDLTIKVTCSAGIAQHVGGQNAENVVKRADEALYEAKRTGRNRVVTA